VLSANLQLRHLTTTDRSLIAARLATLRWGERRRTQKSPLTVKEAAQRLRVSSGSVKRARDVLHRGDEALIARVQAHDLSISAAASRLPPKVRPQRTLAETYTVAAWRGLSAEDRSALLAIRDRTARLNAQNAGEDDNPIDWARFSWSVVTGCEHDCPYCYIGQFTDEVPAFHPRRLAAPLNQAPQVSSDPRDRRIFVCSLADLFGRWVPDEWINAVLDIIRACPTWTFILLTKFPQRLIEFDFPANVWLGTTVDLQARVGNAEGAFAKLRERFPNMTFMLSCEPMIEPLKFNRLDLFDIVVIGGASVTPKSPAWHPPLRMVDDLRKQARAAGCRLYEKSNLLVKEAPKDAPYEFTDVAPDLFHYLGAPPATVHHGGPPTKGGAEAATRMRH
jgi:protein gp37